MLIQRSLRLRAALALVATLAGLALWGCDALKPEAATALTDVQSIEDFKGLFNAGTGSPRVILLLSPT